MSGSLGLCLNFSFAGGLTERIWGMRSWTWGASTGLVLVESASIIGFRPKEDGFQNSVVLFGFHTLALIHLR